MFARNRTGNYEIYTMNADGSCLRRLTFTGVTPGVRPGPPTGGSSFHAGQFGSREIYSMNADGADVQALTRLSSDNAYPAASPHVRFLADQERQRECVHERDVVQFTQRHLGREQVAPLDRALKPSLGRALAGHLSECRCGDGCRKRTAQSTYRRRQDANQTARALHISGLAVAMPKRRNRRLAPD